GRIHTGVVNDLTEHIDVPATIVDMLGLDPLPLLHGRSLRPYLEGKRIAGRDHIFSEYPLFMSIYGNKDYIIKVTESPETKFSGNYLVMEGESSSSHSVNGTTPEWYRAKGSSVSVAFQKQSADGYLQVEVVRNGETAKFETTSAPRHDGSGANGSAM